MADSENQPEHEDDDDLPLSDELQRIEEMLAELRPVEPRAAFSRRVQARLAGALRGKSSRSGSYLFESHPAHSGDSATERRRRLWSRAVPLGIAALVTLSGVVLLHHLANLPPVEPVPSYSQGVDATSNDGAAETTGSRYIEVSAERSLRDVEEEDIVVVDGVGPMRPVLLHYEEAQCWVDPDTQTSVQVIVPREEMVFYPVSTY